MKPKRPRIIVFDNDGHCYLIPANQEIEFDEWLRAEEKGLQYHLDFNEYSIDNPSKIIIHEFDLI